MITKSRGGKFFEFLYCPFEGRADMHHKIQAEGLVRWDFECPMYDFKILFFLILSYIHRAKYIFSSDMFCLHHFWAKIHGVVKVPLNHLIKRNLFQNNCPCMCLRWNSKPEVCTLDYLKLITFWKENFSLSWTYKSMIEKKQTFRILEVRAVSKPLIFTTN